MVTKTVRFRGSPVAYVDDLFKGDLDHMSGLNENNVEERAMFIPRCTCVVVRIDKAKETKGGIVLPDEHSESGPAVGTVVAVGPGDRDRDEPTILIPPHNLAPGMKVIVNRHAGSRMERDGQVFMFVDEKAVLAIEQDDVAPAQTVGTSSN